MGCASLLFLSSRKLAVALAWTRIMMRRPMHLLIATARIYVSFVHLASKFTLIEICFSKFVVFLEQFLD